MKSVRPVEDRPAGALAKYMFGADDAALTTAESSVSYRATPCPG